MIVALSACGNPESPSILPLGVTVSTPELENVTRDAIDGINAVLGPVFELRAGEVEVRQEQPIESNRGSATLTYDSDGAMDTCIVRIIDIPKNEEQYDPMIARVIAHELFHCLGFLNEDHLQNAPECIFGVGGATLADPDTPINELICPEMVDLFESRYGSVN